MFSLQVNTSVTGATECVQALSGVLPEPITFPKEVVKDNDVYPPEVAPPLEVISPKE